MRPQVSAIQAAMEILHKEKNNKIKNKRKLVSNFKLKFRLFSQNRLFLPDRFFKEALSATISNKILTLFFFYETELHLKKGKKNR